MTYGELKNLVLRHIDQYTVAGSPVPLDYNNQADFVNKIPDLTNIALRTIATQAAPLTGTIIPYKDCIDDILLMSNGWCKISMPCDFWRIRGDGIGLMGSDGFRASRNYRFLSAREILVRRDELPTMMITYDRFPRKVRGVDTEDLDCDESVAQCASFYIAAQLMRTEDPYAYQSLFNEYSNMLSQLVRPITADFVRSEDVYGVPAFY
jgi:hypothetical protein